jgi:radical SAM protein with 4Fe4S-binding SPASM domain
MKHTIDTMIGATCYPLLKRLRDIRVSPPEYVKVETTNMCNAHCSYCPHSVMKREQGFMCESLYDKILVDLRKWGITELHLFNFGEPLLDRKLENKIRKANDFNTSVYTNGRMLDETRARSLFDAELGTLLISFDGFSKETFEENRLPFKYDDVYTNLFNAVKLKHEQGYGTKVGVTAVYDMQKTTPEEVASFRNKMEELKLDSIIIQRLHNWHGFMPLQGMENLRCPDLYTYMTILYDGTIAPCCLDYEGSVPMGNAIVDRLQDVWHGKRYTEFRKKHGNYQMCKDCTKQYKYPYLSTLK